MVCYSQFCTYKATPTKSTKPLTSFIKKVTHFCEVCKYISVLWLLQWLIKLLSWWDWTLPTCWKLFVIPEWMLGMSTLLRGRPDRSTGMCFTFLCFCFSGMFTWSSQHCTISINPTGHELCDGLNEVCLREDAFVDGCPNQLDARHQTALCFLHWSTWHCWIWNLWCEPRVFDN